VVLFHGQLVNPEANSSAIARNVACTTSGPRRPRARAGASGQTDGTLQSYFAWLTRGQPMRGFCHDSQATGQDKGDLRPLYIPRQGFDSPCPKGRLLDESVGARVRTPV